MNQTLQSLTSFSFYLSIIAYFLSMLIYWLLLMTKKNILERFATAFAVIGLVANTITLITHAILAQRLPLSNGYEFILTFSWGIVLILLFSEFRFKLKTLGSFVMPVPFLLLLFAFMTMGPTGRIIQAIPPALKSNWLTFHVITAILAYGAFAVSFGLGIMYLCKIYSGENSNIVRLVTRFPDANFLDELAYKLIVFGFSFLTLVIITGAIWANYAWGTYWSWDPKETWSLITWIIYAGYLHARLMYDWKGKRAAWLAVLGFASVLFTFFGVNYLLPGLHSYA
ncbi:MAG: c-type cytochrome biogenesis protein CcsB [Bacillota bacterium]|nr:c-type cytochrome biogenesis protein CcsB [Bacillota bacterium]